jgi:hypothetical protein
MRHFRNRDSSRYQPGPWLSCFPSRSGKDQPVPSPRRLVLQALETVGNSQSACTTQVTERFVGPDEPRRPHPCVMTNVATKLIFLWSTGNATTDKPKSPAAAVWRGTYAESRMKYLSK